MDAKRLIQAIEDAEFTPRSYSGRGMYGRTCVGFTADGSPFQAAVALSLALQDDGLIPELESLHSATDAMGFGIIIYFPGVPWPDEDEDEDEDEDAA